MKTTLRRLSSPPKILAIILLHHSPPFLWVLLLSSAVAAQGQTVSTWSGGTGDWLDPARWSPAGVPNSPTTDVVVDNAPGTASVVTLGRNDNVGTSATVGRLTIAAGDTVRFGSANTGLGFGDNNAFAGAGSLVLNGTLSLPFSSNGLGGNKTITGTGMLLLGSAGQRPEITGFTSNAATIKGSALFGRANASNPQMVNSGLIEANLSGQDIDFHGQGGANRSVNTGTLKAGNGGRMQFGQGEWLNTGGQIIADGAGSQVAFYRGGLLEGGTVSAVNGGLLQVGGSFNGSNGGYTFKDVTLNGPTNLVQTLLVDGTITNNGIISIPGGGLLHNASNSTTIAGTGEIVLDAPEDTTPELIDQGNSGLTSVPWLFDDVKVRGRGNVGYKQSGGAIDNVDITNQGTFQADVDGERLLIDVRSIDNRNGGFLRATGSGNNALGGILRLSTHGPLQNTGGTIEALNKGRVEANFARIEGGLVRNNGGFIDLNGMTLVNPGGGMTLEGEHTLGHPTVHQEARLVGEIENKGVLRVEGGTQRAILAISEQANPSVTLRGGGEIRLGDPANPGRPGEMWDSLDGSFRDRTLTNGDNLIRGFGRIGNTTYEPRLVLKNQKTVQADVAERTLSIGLLSATNSGGVFRASNGGRMDLYARGRTDVHPTNGFDNTNGTVEALANSTVAFSGTEITGGIVSSAPTGTIGFQDSNIARGGVMITNAGTAAFGERGGNHSLNGLDNGGSTLNNIGTMRKIGGGDYSVRTALNSTGAMNVESGVLRNFGGGTVSANTFTISTDAHLTFQGAAPYTFSGVTTSSGGGILHIDDKVYLADANAELRTDNFRFHNGTLSGPGLFSHAGRLEFYQGTNNAVSGSRLLTKTGATASIESYYYAPLRFLDGATWENHGTIAFADAGWRPAVTGTTDTAIINRAGGVIRNDDSESGTLDIPTQNQGRFEVARGRLFLDKTTAWTAGTASMSAGTELLVRNAAMTLDGTANSTTGEGWLQFVGTGQLSLPAASRLAAERVGFWDASGISGPGELRVAKAAEWRPPSGATQIIDGAQVNLLADSANLIEASGATLRLQNNAALRNAGTLDLRRAFVMELNSGGILENAGTITATSTGNNPRFGGDGTGLFRTLGESVTRFFPSNGNGYVVSIPVDFAGLFSADSGIRVTFDRGGLLNETAKLWLPHASSEITFTGTEPIRVRGQANEWSGIGYVNLNNTTLEFVPSSIAGHESRIAAGARVAFHGNNTVKGGGTLGTTGFVFQNGDQTVDGAVLQTSGTADVSIWNANGRRVQFKNGAEFRNGGRFVIQARVGSEGNPGFYGEAGTRFHNTQTGRLVHDANTSTVFGLPFHNDGVLEFSAGTINFAGGFTGTGGLAVSNGFKLDLDLKNTPANQLPRFLEAKGNGSQISVVPPPGGLAASLVGLDGGTLVSAGGLNLIDGTRVNLSGLRTQMTVSGLISVDHARIVTDNGAGLISDNGAILKNRAELALAGAGTKGQIAGLVELDASEVIARDGASFEVAGPLIGNDGSTLIGNDGSTLIGNALIGNDGSTLIGNDGSTLIGNDGSTFAPTGRAAARKVSGGPAPRSNSVPGGSGTIVANTGSLIAGNGTFRGHGYVLTGSSLFPGKHIPGGANQIGAMQWDGALEIDTGCTLGVQIGGKTAGTQHDVLNVTGALTMNGALAVSFANRYGAGLLPTDAFDIAVAAGGITSSLDGARVPVSNGNGTFLASVVNGGSTLRLSDYNGVPATFNRWAESHGLTGADAAPLADPFKTGMSNLMKYALGLGPRASSGDGWRLGQWQDESGQHFLTLSYTRPTGVETPADLTYEPQRSTSLATGAWPGGPEHIVPVGEPVPGPGGLETVTVRSTHPRGSGPEFLRLAVTLTPP